MVSLSSGRRDAGRYDLQLEVDRSPLRRSIAGSLASPDEVRTRGTPQSFLMTGAPDSGPLNGVPSLMTVAKTVHGAASRCIRHTGSALGCRTINLVGTPYRGVRRRPFSYRVDFQTLHEVVVPVVVDDSSGGLRSELTSTHVLKSSCRSSLSTMCARSLAVSMSRHCAGSEEMMAIGSGTSPPGRPFGVASGTVGG